MSSGIRALRRVRRLKAQLQTLKQAAPLGQRLETDHHEFADNFDTTTALHL
jgi:hypothetical protein